MNVLGPSSTYNASDGGAYEVFLGRWARRLARLFLDFVRFPDTGDILDVGCGTGALTFTMADRWPQRRIVGIDVSEPFLWYARSHRSGDMPIFQIADACALPFRDGQFVGATTQLVLVFIPKPDLAVREMRRVTRSGGIIAATHWDYRGGLVFQRMLWDTICGIDPAAKAVRNRLFADPLALPGGLQNLFRDAGLVNIERESLTFRMDFDNFDDYWNPLSGGQGPVGTYLVNLASDLKACMKEAVFDAYCSGSPDGPRSMTATTWAVRGTVP